MLQILIVLSTLVSAPAFAAEDVLKPFTSDYCSWFIDGKGYRDCCVDHDKDYWMGGTRDERWKADENLKACFKAKGYAWLSMPVYWGVRMGGMPYRNTSYRWGYGWPKIRMYGPLTPSEKAQVEARIQQWEAQTGQSW